MMGKPRHGCEVTCPRSLDYSTLRLGASDTREAPLLSLLSFFLFQRASVRADRGQFHAPPRCPAHSGCSVNHRHAKMSEAHIPEPLPLQWPDSTLHTVGAQPCSLSMIRVIPDARKGLGPWDSHGPHLPPPAEGRLVSNGLGVFLVPAFTHCQVQRQKDRF